MAEVPAQFIADADRWAESVVAQNLSKIPDADRANVKTVLRYMALLNTPVRDLSFAVLLVGDKLELTVQGYKSKIDLVVFAKWFLSSQRDDLEMGCICGAYTYPEQVGECKVAVIINCTTFVKASAQPFVPKQKKRAMRKHTE